MQLLVVVFTTILSAQAIGDFAALRLRAESGDAKAQLELSHAYEDGRGVDKNENLAFEWLMKAAHSGNPDAENEAGVAYRLGRGVGKDLKEAVRWYRKAARHGSANAMFNLGTVYFNGEGEHISDVRAYAWFYLAQRAGSQEAAEAVLRTRENLQQMALYSAEFLVGQMLDDGVDVAPDYAEAARIYRSLSDREDAMAQFALSKMLAEGRGVAQDAAASLRLCEKSAKQDHLPALFDIGLRYHTGLGVQRDLEKARKWYERAAAKGSGNAANNLGTLYAADRKDPVSAYTWFAVAAILKHPNAAAMMTKLEAEMSPKDIAQSRSKAVKWARDVAQRKRVSLVR